jgi:hypothetical protein
MWAIRALLTLLVIIYFVVPSLVSEFLFENNFYIYSNLQAISNTRSLIYGAIFIIWVHLLFRRPRSLLFNGNMNRLVAWPGMRISYYALILYSILLILHGQQLRASGASREVLLSGMDEFLLPGMSLLLLCALVFAVAKAKKWQFYGLFIFFLLIDATYNGKIFSYLALVLFFMRIDHARPSTRTIVKVFALWALLGVTMLFLSGLTRVTLAGDDLTVNATGIAYLFGSEFLGVQASIGWGMSYFAQGYLPSFWNFGSTLETFYKSSVGHGLATSPGAFFEANFGSMGPIFAIFFCGICLLLFRFSAQKLGWVAYLVLVINFQHFLRHGVDVFLVKVVSQMFFAIFIAGWIRLSRHASVQNHAQISHFCR